MAVSLKIFPASPYTVSVGRPITSFSFNNAAALLISVEIIQTKVRTEIKINLTHKHYGAFLQFGLTIIRISGQPYEDP